MGMGEGHEAAPTSGPIVSWPGRLQLVALWWPLSNEGAWGMSAGLDSTEPGRSHVVSMCLGPRLGPRTSNVLWVWAFFFWRWLIHAKCLMMPATHRAGIRSPLKCRVFLEVPKNSSKVYFGHHTSSTCQRQGRLPRQHAGENTWAVRLFPLFCLVLSTDFQASHHPGGRKRG